MPYTLPRTASSTSSLFSLDMVGNEKHQNASASADASTGNRRLIAANARMLKRSLPVSRSLRSSIKENIIDPIIIADMKQENISPNGGNSVTPEMALDDFKAGDQKKTKRYIDPSKTVVATARVKMRLSNNVLWSPAKPAAKDFSGSAATASP
ncbi:hypothetical protein AC578_4564 [Pseudocercospora eumusae]|uniref:Uncharacterized protein n=1 Tax=Pseudocercospora eumusae TaxID=321146 RepID=A0A139HGG3_9PEZI|nr:hypothetical protein AC578_4564 [Pseudocercospora eumusae]